jgi:hypothetical protein
LRNLVTALLDQVAARLRERQLALHDLYLLALSP